MHLLDWLLRPTRPGQDRPCDPLPDIIDHARRANAEAIAAVNESRQRRGEEPLGPAWEDLLYRDGGRDRGGG